MRPEPLAWRPAGRPQGPRRAPSLWQRAAAAAAAARALAALARGVVRAFPRRLDAATVRLAQVERLVGKLVRARADAERQRQEERASGSGSVDAAADGERRGGVFSSAPASTGRLLPPLGDGGPEGADGAPHEPSTPAADADADADVEDLQHVSADALVRAKARMDVGFEQRRLRPGDEGWQYDVQVDFEEGTEANDWDDESDDDDAF
eukprot:PRCOL_00007050-RA